MSTTTEHRFIASESSGEVGAIFTRPAEPVALFVFGHGAGAGMRHAFMQAASDGLVANGVATFRYNFPYMEVGKKVPSPRPILLKTVRSAVRAARELMPGLPVVAGGKSMGGRMTSLAASAGPIEGVVGLAFFGFPLHPSGKDSTERGEHLADVGLPMLFLQGTRDKLANLELLTSTLQTVVPEPTLHIEEGADHGFHVLKRSGRTDEEALESLCARFGSWVESVVSST